MKNGIKKNEKIGGLIKKMSEGTIFLRKQSLYTLGKKDDEEATEVLEYFFGDRDVDIRKTVAGVLGDMKNEAGVNVLVKGLNDADWDVREEVVKALGKKKELKAVVSLVENIDNEDWYDRGGIVDAIGNTRNPKGIEALSKALKHKDVKKQAMAALIKMGVPALDLILQALKDKDICEMAALAFAQLGESVVRELAWFIENENDVSLEASVKAFVCIGEASVSCFADDFSSKSERLKKIAVEALGKIGGKEAKDFFVSVLGDNDVNVRVKAVEFLGIDATTVEFIIKSLKDSSPFVREKAAVVLGNLKDPAAIEGLLELSSDQYEFVRNKAACAVEKIRDNTHESKRKYFFKTKIFIFAFLFLLLGVYILYSNYVEIFLR